MRRRVCVVCAVECLSVLLMWYLILNENILIRIAQGGEDHKEKGERERGAWKRRRKSGKEKEEPGREEGRVEKRRRSLEEKEEEKEKEEPGREGGGEREKEKWQRPQ